MRKIIAAIFLFSLLFSVRQLKAQHFSGTKGSIYSPVINTASNPAAGASMPYSWSIEIAGANSFWSNNIIALSPARFDWKQDTINLNPYFITGKAKRWGTLNADVHLLNFLLHIPGHKNWVAGAGWNIRSRTFADQMEYNYQDSLSVFSHFLKANAVKNRQKGRLINQQWMEWFITASTILRENRFEKITLGASLKLVQGMSAEVVDINGLQVGLPTNDGKKYTSIIYFSGRYGYSENLEDIEDDQRTNEQLQTFTKGGPLSAGFDIGFSYTRKKPIWIAGFTLKDPANYKWKISVALTDFGRLKYPPGKESRIINGVRNQPDLNYLQRSLEQAPSLTAFNDSLSRITTIRPWEDDLSMSLPTALRVGFDKNMGRHFFVHTHLVLDASFLNPGVAYQSHTINHLIVTPRWEIKRIGFYAPLYLNDRGTFLAGAAIRLGPLTAGLHDFRWLFDHTKSGGAYIALSIKNFFREKEECFSF